MLIGSERYPKEHTIIVVEDEEDICDLIAEDFEELGAACTYFCTADAALNHLYKTEGSVL